MEQEEEEKRSKLKAAKSKTEHNEIATLANEPNHNDVNNRLKQFNDKMTQMNRDIKANTAELNAMRENDKCNHNNRFAPYDQPRPIVCYTCNKPGHKSNMCTQRRLTWKQDQQERGSQQTCDKSLNSNVASSPTREM
jgi:hypothetical protein